MEFIQGLQELLKKQRFQRVDDDSQIVWIREEENVSAMIMIVPERLPGQPWISVAQREKNIGALETKLMVRTGKKVDRLTLMLCHDLPDEQSLRETADYPDIWWVDWKNGRLLIYENQRTDFRGLKNILEQYLEVWMENEKQTDRMELRRVLQPVTTLIVIMNLLVFLTLSVIGNTEDSSFMAAHGALTWDAIWNRREYYRLITSLFLHFGATHLFQNMLILMLTGSRLERAAGGIRYLLIYLGAGLTGSAASILFTLHNNADVAAGASGAIFGIMGGMICLILKDSFRREKVYIKEIGLTGIIFMVVCAASYGFFNSGIDNAAHLGGLAGGFILTMLLTISRSQIS